MSAPCLGGAVMPGTLGPMGFGEEAGVCPWCACGCGWSAGFLAAGGDAGSGAAGWPRGSHHRCALSRVWRCQVRFRWVRALPCHRMS